MKYKPVHRLSLVAVALILLLALIPMSCQRSAGVGDASKADTIPWKDILRDTHFDTARQVVEALENEVAQHRNGAEPNDDLTMLCLRVQ